MSYNTELQSNNTELQAILDAVNALPEAGTGGGGSVEAVNINVMAAAPWGVTSTVYYVDPSGAQQTLSQTEGTITVMKNSLLLIASGGDGVSARNNARIYMFSGKDYLYYITADDTFKI